MGQDLYQRQAVELVQDYESAMQFLVCCVLYSPDVIAALALEVIMVSDLLPDERIGDMIVPISKMF